MADPIHQFQIQKVVDLPDVTLPGVGVVDLAITNSHIAMTLGFILVVGFLAMVTSVRLRRRCGPRRSVEPRAGLFKNRQSLPP